MVAAYTTYVTLQQYAWRIAGPRDCAINVLINGPIAWWLFGRWDVVPLGSAFVMLIPMVFLEATLTTYFGLLSGRAFRRRTAAPPRAGIRPPPPVRGALVCGVVGLLACLACDGAVRYACAAAVLPGWAMAAAITAPPTTMAFALHTRAVLVAGR